MFDKTPKRQTQNNCRVNDMVISDGWTNYNPSTKAAQATLCLKRLRLYLRKKLPTTEGRPFNIADFCISELLDATIR
jgi:hypothetical protein